MVMFPNGSIYGYVSDRECRWNLDGDVLFITNADNEITSRYKYNGSVFLGEVEGEKHPLYLVPIIATSDFDTVSAPKIFVNSIPKSGTYFVEAALTQAGCLHTGCMSAAMTLLMIIGACRTRISTSFPIDGPMVRLNG
jgi:hypothetical protein